MGLKKEVDKDERERERVAQGVENTRESASQCHYQFWRGISLTGAHVCLSVWSDRMSPKGFRQNTLNRKMKIDNQL